MKTQIFLLLLAFLVLSSFQANAQSLDENFDYPEGDPVTDHGWVTIGTTTDPVPVVVPGLSFDNYIGSGMGYAAGLTGAGQDVGHVLSPVLSSGSVYVTFMVNVSVARTGDFFFGLLPASGTGYRARVFVKGDGGSGVAFGISNSTEAAQYTPFDYTTNTTYLLMVKYTFVSGSSNNTMSLTVFTTTPPPTEPAATIPAFTTGASELASVNRVALLQNSATNSPDMSIDGIYVNPIYDNSVLPVELASFTSEVTKRDVTLKWTTSSETNNNGFDIERSVANGSWSKVGFVSGNGSTSGTSAYTFTDRSLSTGTYLYRLKQTDFNGNFEYFNLSNEVVIGIPSEFRLSQNYPNPFNPSTKIDYDIPFDSKVSISIFELSGKEIGMIVNENKPAGYHTASFNASGISSGVYFYSIKAEGNGVNHSATRKMVLIK